MPALSELEHAMTTILLLLYLAISLNAGEILKEKILKRLKKESTTLLSAILDLDLDIELDRHRVH